MKWALICLTTLLALPRLVNAQVPYDVDNDYGPPPYNDVENGQALQLAAYILAPFGYALEWGVTRPLHHAATDTAAAPVLSGDTQIRYFGETNNADRLPPGTFAPFPMPANPNAIDPDSGPPTTYTQQTNPLPPVTKTDRYNAQGYVPGSGGQSAFH